MDCQMRLVQFMPTVDKTERCSIGRVVDLRAVCVNQGLQEEVPITLMSGDVVS